MKTKAGPVSLNPLHRSVSISNVVAVPSAINNDLEDWLARPNNYGCKVWLGPGGTYVAHNDSGGSYRNVTNKQLDTLLDDTDQHLKMVALGISGSYVLLWKGGGYRWSVEASYPDLDRILDEAQLGDVVVRLWLLQPKEYP